MLYPPPKPVREDWSRSRDLAPGHVTIVQMSRDLPSRSRDHRGVTWANSTRYPKGNLVGQKVAKTFESTCWNSVQCC